MHVANIPHKFTTLTVNVIYTVFRRQFQAPTEFHENCNLNWENIHFLWKDPASLFPPRCLDSCPNRNAHNPLQDCTNIHSKPALKTCRPTSAWFCAIPSIQKKRKTLTRHLSYNSAWFLLCIHLMNSRLSQLTRSIVNVSISKCAARNMVPPGHS